MKNYTVNSSVLSVLKECTFFDEGSGLKSLPSTHFKETKVGKKFVYVPSGSERNHINAIHESLNKSLFSRIPINQAATAYSKNKSYLNFLEPHRNSYYFLRLDLKNFFHFINRTVVRNSISEHVSSSEVIEGCSQSNLDFIVNILTITLPDTSKNEEFSGKTILPIGFKSSPVVSNIVFRKLDILIERFCAKNNVTYTRYADDMLFSSSTVRDDKYREKSVFDDLFKKKEKVPFLHSDKFIEEISFIVNIDGFKLNRKKTVKSKKHLSLNGYLISGSDYPYLSGSIRISNKKTKIISKMIHECNKDQDDISLYKSVFGVNPSKINFRYKPNEAFLIKYCRSQVLNKLVGYRSYLISILKFNENYSCIDGKFINKCESLTRCLETIIESRMDK
ncbi:reverse transcriptase family protein [Vibrio sp. ECSMB14106]|uniref:reverse transcriptase family protein n=1 Tax=Vibrio sp. ECSMB14106 TaxID=1638949 RepID=UPI0006194630|nr:reverse transcriptase family protein [Vibrio sp. ECSMB14106]